MNSITIIMYHYVRELAHSPYPSVKALETSKFREQITYLRKNYSIVSAEECMRAIKDSSFSLPENPALLTFDDGYSDHFTAVFPILDAHNIPGCFFVPVKAVKDHRLLDVNKIHFILASVDDSTTLVEEINTLLKKYKNEYDLKEPSYYFKKLAGSDRYDSREVVFIKRLLQKELELQLRNKITDHLFQKFVGVDEETFARELYMSMDQIKCLTRNGMYVGGHGSNHLWLDHLSPGEQEKEIDETLNFLDEVGSSTEEWIMCYPYGAYNDALIELLKEKNCSLGLTTKVAKAQLTAENAYTLERFDTNDLQKLIEGKANAISGRE